MSVIVRRPCLSAAATMNAPVEDDRCEGLVADLLARMTADEKIGQLTWIPAPQHDENADWAQLDHQIAAGEVGAVLGVRDPVRAVRLQTIAHERARLSVPLLFPADVDAGTDTILPSPLALAASWDIDAVEAGAAVIGGEARENGANWLYSSEIFAGGLTQLAALYRGTGLHLACEIERAFMSGLHDTDAPEAFASLFERASPSPKACIREIPKEQIDEAVARVLRCKFRLGLIGRALGPPARMASHSLPTPVRNREIALDLARKCAVLLRNDPRLLPLGIDSGEILVVGSAATDRQSPLAGKRGVAASVIDGLEQLGIPHRFVLGLALRDHGEASGRMRAADRMAIGMASEAAKRAGTVIFVHASHEETGLSEADSALLYALVTANPRVALVTLGSAPLDPSVDGRNLWTILHAGPLGTMSGHAIAELLTGEASPSGRLAVAVRHESDDAGLPFGHGLSYSDVMLGNLAIDAGPDRIALTCEVENRGDRRGSETVQVYLDAPEPSDGLGSRKSSRLVAFRKLWFNPGEREVLHFELGRSEFGLLAAEESDPIRPGRYCLRVGLDEKRAMTREIVLTKSLARAMGRQTAEPSPLETRQKA